MSFERNLNNPVQGTRTQAHTHTDTYRHTVTQGDCALSTLDWMRPWPQKQHFNFCQIVTQAAFVKSKTYVAAGLKLYMSLAADRSRGSGRDCGRGSGRDCSSGSGSNWASDSWGWASEVVATAAETSLVAEPQCAGSLATSSPSLLPLPSPHPSPLHVLVVIGSCCCCCADLTHQRAK